MKKFDAKFIKYSVVLFVVSVILISVGAVSLTGISERTDKTNASAKTRIDVLSNQNLEIKNQNESLKAENEALKAENKNLQTGQERYIAINSLLEAEAMAESGDFENAKICLEKIDTKYLEGFAKGKYDKLYQIVKENTQND